MQAQLHTADFPAGQADLHPCTQSAVAGAQGRNRFKLYQQLLAFAFALVQGGGQLLYLKSYVPGFDIQWFLISLSILTGGAMLLVKVGCCICTSGATQLCRQEGCDSCGDTSHLLCVPLPADGLQQKDATMLKACIQAANSRPSL